MFGCDAVCHGWFVHSRYRLSSRLGARVEALEAGLRDTAARAAKASDDAGEAVPGEGEALTACRPSALFPGLAFACELHMVGCSQSGPGEGALRSIDSRRHGSDSFSIPLDLTALSMAKRLFRHKAVVREH